jgi:L-threonylcarbamoyladenylate synthase
MPRVLRVDPVNPEPDLIREAADAMRHGSLVAFPTETVYGLGARGLREEDVLRLFEAKGRPPTHPLILHVASLADVERLAGPLSGAGASLAAALWPGPLTLVVPRASHVPRAVSAGLDTMAVRVPAHPIALALARELGEPIAAPSANAHTGVSPTTAEHVMRSLGAAVDLVLDGGATPRGIESSVVDVTGARPVLLRPGSTSVARLRELAPDLEVPVASAVSDAAARPSPGMAERHYAPRAKVAVVASRELAARFASAAGKGGRVAVCAWSDDARAWAAGRDSGPDDCIYILSSSPEAYGASLYAVLHDVDARGYDELVMEAVPDGELWLAVRDRLRRAAAER